MKRPAVLFLTSLALLSGLSDAARRSGGGFGGSRSSSSSRSSGSTSRPPNSNSSTPRYTPPSSTRPNNNSGTVTAPRPTRTPSTTQRSASYPSTASVRNSPLNTAAASRVTQGQLSNWNKVSLPAGVSRSAITYSATPSSQYRYQLQPGRYFPYPQSYYRQHNLGYDILKYALIFTAVGSIADAMTPDVVVNNVNVGTSAQTTSQTTGQGDLSDVRDAQVTTVQDNRGPNLWTYVGVGFLAAAAAWFLGGRRRKM